MIIEFQKLSEKVETPIYATVGSAGFDLVADNFKALYSSANQTSDPETFFYYDMPNELTLLPHSRLLVGCGFSVAIPEGYIMDIRPRSGLALKQGLTVINSPGTIDSDYRGEIGVILHNTTPFSVTIKLGDKIAQGLILKYEVALFKTVETLSRTARGEGGFGHTG